MSKTTDEIEKLLEENNKMFEEVGAAYGFDNYTVVLVKNLIEEVKRYEKELDLDYVDKNFIEIRYIEKRINKLREKRDKAQTEMMFILYNYHIQALSELIREYKEANEKK